MICSFGLFKYQGLGATFITWETKGVQGGNSIQKELEKKMRQTDAHRLDKLKMLPSHPRGM